MIKYGIKIWSINEDWFTEAIILCKKNQIDFVELYLVPDKIPESVKKFKGIEMQIHAPHSSHGFNIFKFNQEKINFFQEQVVKTANLLNAQNIIVHAGVGEDKLIFMKNIKLISNNRLLIENKPKVGLNNELCFGHSLDQLVFIRNKCGLKICLDFGHAIKSAASEKTNYKDSLINLLGILKPTYFHLSGGYYDNEQDEHLNLFEGNIDGNWIKNKLEKLSKNNDIRLVFETPKVGNNLDNDLKNIEYFKNLPGR